VTDKVLLVEGKDDKFVIAELMKSHGLNFTTAKDIEWIKPSNGYENLAKQEVIATELLASGLTILGIIIDADEHPNDRWTSIRNVCLKSIPNLPKDLPENGLIWNAPNDIKFGIWIVPDNKMRGMLETFLADIIPEENQVLWEFAKESVQEAKVRGSKVTPNHIDKANIYTWLAWQEPSGLQISTAVKKRTIFDRTHPNAQKFVTWFKTLYGL
jgi:hypothetical protein